ncbi:hypothetical protein M501DRAFT_924187 [Patellaria atrata CBS 101060]|uniref:Uncharacterized protein n=1 Tax=Patellaria atrata CBS 101060 TaxID=1346257 RepID=A0A9P4SIW0_9PEZI|nr:hypothetical protein M501DRAFT_924187 [Patellaria atrata CBS 101060]
MSELPPRNLSHEGSSDASNIDIPALSPLDTAVSSYVESSSTEEELVNNEGEEVESVIGVSISRAQTRLTSTRTPAAEKAAAIEELGSEGLFPPFLDGIGQGDTSSLVHEGLPVGQSTTEPFPQSTFDGSRPELPPNNGSFATESTPRLPSPWKAGPKWDWTKAQRFDETRAALRESFNAHRRRASSGGSATEGLRKMLQFNIPSLTKGSQLLSLSSPSGTSSPRSDLPASQSSGPSFPRIKASTLPIRRSLPVGIDGSAHKYSTVLDTPKGLQSNTEKEQQTVRSDPITQSLMSSKPLESSISSTPRRSHSTLRRSISDDSLLLRRDLSRASSLGDDTRFEHVTEQVNSRLKAIKDSWQDANFKLPSLPTIPTLNFSSSKPEPHHARYSAILPKASSSSGHVYRPNRSTSSALHINSSGKSPLRKEFSMSQNGLTASTIPSHPFFNHALEQLEGDVVILGGYRGSILRSAEPPHRQLWVPIKVGLNLRKVDLEVGLNPEDEETMEEQIIPGGMLKNIGPVDIARRLFKRLRASENAKNGKLRVHEYGYDWRLSPHLLSRRFISYLEKLPNNTAGTSPKQKGVIVIAHSLGGLITRHAVNQRPDLFAGVIYAGVPNTCVNILGPLRNGDDVLLSSRVLTAQVNFTIRTSFALLPLDGKCFIDKNTREEYPVDFFDPQTWVEYRLSPCLGPPLPSLSAPNSTSIGTIINSMASVLPNIPGLTRKGSIPRTANPTAKGIAEGATRKEASSIATSNAATKASGGAPTSAGMAPQMGGSSNHNPVEQGQSTNTSISTTVTIPRDAALAYLTRTLAEIKRFKEELAFLPHLAEQNLYPPIAVIYGKSVPTVYGAKVDGREGIKRADAYDELAFASGDGVVLARAAMVPEGYPVVRGGVVSSDRGHVTLLGDLEAVGRCLGVVVGVRKGGIGLGRKENGVAEL